MQNILSIFGILCVCFGIILNFALVNGTSFEEVLQGSGVLNAQPLANVEKKCTSRGMFCVPKSMCSEEQIITYRTNIGRTRNETIECSLDKVCCSIPPVTEVSSSNDNVCTGADNFCVPNATCINGEIDISASEVINPFANSEREEKCNVTQVCCKLVKKEKEQTGENCTGPLKYCVPKQTCINGNIDTSAGAVLNPFSTVNAKCDQSEVCCQYGGQDVKGQAKYGEFPGVVQVIEMIYDHVSSLYIYQCVGSLVAPNVVLTTAHNLANSSATDLLVRAGDWDTRINTEPEPHADRDVKTIIIHENFNNHSLNFDIAILILSDKFRLGPLINTISLPSADMNFDNSRCIVAGWGKKQKTDTDNSPILKKIDVSVLNRETCQAQLRESLNFRFYALQSSFICAEGDVENPCDGDGGAPLMCPVVGSPNRYVLAGVLSFSSKCNTRNAPGVFINVPMVISWFSQKTNLI